MVTQTSRTDESAFSAKHMELVEDGHVICEHCGDDYDHTAVEMPEDATFYWVPSCPSCGASMTCNPISKMRLNLAGSRLNRSEDNYESQMESLQGKARLYHGRLVGYDNEELIRRAKWFDRKAKSGKAYGPRFYRDIAFNLRKQARKIDN